MAINKINSLAIGSVAKVNSLLKASMATSPFSGGLGSISCWFKLNTVSVTKHLFCITENNTLGSNFIRVFYHAGRNQLYSQHKGTGTTVSMITSTAVENNGWHHLAFTWDVGEGAGIIYIDGSAVNWRRSYSSVGI